MISNLKYVKGLTLAAALALSSSLAQAYTANQFSVEAFKPVDNQSIGYGVYVKNNTGESVTLTHVNDCHSLANFNSVGSTGPATNSIINTNPKCNVVTLITPRAVSAGYRMYLKERNYFCFGGCLPDNPTPVSALPSGNYVKFKLSNGQTIRVNTDLSVTME